MRSRTSRRKRPHAPVLGQLRGAASLRRAARRHHRHRAPRRGRARSRSRRQPAPRSRMDGVRASQATRRQAPDPGRDRVEVELRRASGAHRATHRSLREPRRTRERHRRQRLRLSAPGSDRPPSIRTSCGPRCARWPRARASPRVNSGSSETKSRAVPGFSSNARSCLQAAWMLRRLLALRAVRDFERDLLAFLQRLESLTLDRREMREKVLAAVIGLDESETLRIVEPLDRTGSHDFYILETKIKMCAGRGRRGVRRISRSGDSRDGGGTKCHPGTECFGA